MSDTIVDLDFHLNESLKNSWWRPVSRLTFSREKINQYLTDIN